LPFEILEKSVHNSLVFGVYRQEKQIGFARVITDYSTFAYLADVFVLEQFRKIGLGKWLIETIINHPDLQGLQRFLLVTKDAHELYQKFGFFELNKPERFMEKWHPNIYKQSKSSYE